MAKANQTRYPVHLVHIKHKNMICQRNSQAQKIISICCVMPEVIFKNIPIILILNIFQAPFTWYKHAWFSREEKSNRMFFIVDTVLENLKTLFEICANENSNNFNIRKFSDMSTEQQRQCWLQTKNWVQIKAFGFWLW